MRAQGVVAQHLDHPAFGDSAMGALLHHAGQFITQRREAGDPGLHLHQLALGQRIRLGTGAGRIIREAQQIPDRLQRKAQLPRMADEAQPLTGSGIIQALIARTPLRRRQKANLLIIANGGHLHSGGPRELSDRPH